MHRRLSSLSEAAARLLQLPCISRTSRHITHLKSVAALSSAAVGGLLSPCFPRLVTTAAGGAGDSEQQPKAAPGAAFSAGGMDNAGVMRVELEEGCFVGHHLPPLTRQQQQQGEGARDEDSSGGAQKHEEDQAHQQQSPAAEGGEAALADNGGCLPSRVVETSAAELLSLFKTMYTMRRMEVAADMLYKTRLVRGFCHLADGQEAVAAGMAAGTTAADPIIQSYRDHCQYVSRGGSVYEVMCELLGRTPGPARGFGGSMHLYRPRQQEDGGGNFWGGWGIVGSQVPLGAGIALALQQRRSAGACFAIYGDGAANQGQVYEAMNTSALWGLPLVCVVENNHYGMGTAEWRATPDPGHYYQRGWHTAAVPGLKADGMDVLAVKQACQFARQHALRHGPIILELDTYRYHGHSMSDPGSTYRSRDEISATRQERDPLDRLRKLLTGSPEACRRSGGPDGPLMRAEDLKAVEKEVKVEVEKAVEDAKAAPTPPDAWLWKNAYAAPGGVELRGVLPGSLATPDYDPLCAREG